MSSDSRVKLTVAALAHNEALHLPRCFASLRPLISRHDTESLILLDSKADPETSRAAHQLADRVVSAPFVNFAAQRNRALGEARGEWVFFIDPDERCSTALAEEVVTNIESGAAAYRVPRRNILFGREIRHTGWWPDYQIRLLQRDKCHYDERQAVHEVPTVNGEIRTLSEPLVHHNYETWSQFFRKQWAYAKHDARALYASGRRARPLNILGQPLREFKRRFIDYKGYKDGPVGLALSLAMGLYMAKVYVDLWLIQRRSGQ